MKIFLIVVIAVMVVFIIIQTIFSMSSAKTESQAYEVIQYEDNFEIRFYPSVTIAKIISSAKSYKELGNSGFRKLAGYIFGGNDSKQKIAMTTPVHMDINDSASSMSFVMPQRYSTDNLPKPDNPQVLLENTADEFVAVITFSGFASDKDIKEYTGKLEKILKDKAISYYGNFRFLGYNPPFQLFGRRNEVIVSVNWNTSVDNTKNTASKLLK